MVGRRCEEGHEGPWDEQPWRGSVCHERRGEWEDWVMDPSMEETDLVNRARIEG